MLDTIIRRTYNRHGDCDYLIRMDSTPSGWCPRLVRRQATGGQGNGNLRRRPDAPYFHLARPLVP